MRGLAVAVVFTLAAATACGPARGSKENGRGGGSLSALPPSACSQPRGPSDATFIVASDLPLQGGGGEQVAEMVKAMRFVLEQRNFMAGKYRVAYQSCDDSTAEIGYWDPAKCASNAQAYADNQSVIGVVGTFNSGCAKIEIPILNRAQPGPLAIVSPENTAPGLTHAGPGSAQGEPDKYYPTGTRNYARVIAADNFQGAADALWAKELGLKSVYVLTDGETYGDGVAVEMRKALLNAGIKVPGFAAWDKNASSYDALVAKIVLTGADAVFLGGISCNNGAKLITDLKAGYKGTILLPDGFSEPGMNGPAADGSYVSVAGQPPETLTGDGAKFVKDFGAEIGARPNQYSADAAQAMLVLLDAIAKSDGTRASVTTNLLQARVTNGILGTFSIDPNGDTSLNAITIYRQKAGRLYPVKTITPPLATRQETESGGLGVGKP
jgi:branched-chain amino acid transport system substrate-binding protein